MSFAKEQDSRFIITMNRIQQEVMHAVHERFQELETYNIRGVPEVRKAETQKPKTKRIKS